MRELLVSGTVLASFLGGIVALLAPCCVSVMLPAYFAATFRRRTAILGMTLVFAGGVATIILPIGLGASVISRFLVAGHSWVFGIGGALMMLAGIAILAGWKPRLPMPAIRGTGRAGSEHGVGSVYALGVFSGAASACCAPVLAGVIAISGAVSSFPTALAVGVAYVFGMVAPLCVLALVWDRRDWGATKLFTQRTLSLRLGAWRKQLPVSSALSGGLLFAMGVLTAALAVTGPAMPADGWQVRLSSWLDHAAAIVERSVAWLPGWVSALAVLAALAAIVTVAVRRRHGASTPATEPSKESTRETIR